MNRLIVILLLVFSTVAVFAYPVTAYFTGNQRTVTTVTGAYGVICQYRAYTASGEVLLWHTFANTSVCPNSIEVE